MEKQKRNTIMPVVLIGGLCVVVVFLLGTLWMGNSASHDTKTAVRNVSLLYLDELAQRREQVVETTLDDYISDLDVAIGMISEEDISSIESLKAYQARMKQLYGLEKFAFVDNTGLIYTSRGTREDIDKYGFDYKEISEPEISIKNVNSTNKKVVIATPVDNLPFEGKKLVACFMEIDMVSLLDTLSIQSDSSSSTTFCNIYTKDGVALTNVYLGGLANEDNLYDAIEHADFEDVNAVAELKEAFSNGKEGVISFAYNDIQGTMYYVPIQGTDWMLTYMIRESVINEQISSISDGIILRGLAQSILTVVVLVAMFLFMIMQMQKASKLTLEKEVTETENRVRQQELEEQLAMQEELLEQEKRQAEQDKMITALASDYRSVFYIDLDSDEGICYRSDKRYKSDLSEGQKFTFGERTSWYAKEFVDEEYREAFIEFTNPSVIRKSLEHEDVLAIRYLVHRGGKDSYEMLKMAGVRHIDERTDNIVHSIGVGFADIDSEMKESFEKRQILSDALKAAQEASTAKTIFLSSMSHEIRTPMNAIIGLDALALKDPDITDKTREYLVKIDASAKHLLGLINDILDMSRIESGRLVIKNEEFSFAKLIKQVNTIIGGQCEEKGLYYVSSVDEKLDEFYIGDDMKLKQVLINILGNAVKFTPEGGRVDFKIKKMNAYNNKTTLCFEMQDTGIGMSEDFLPKLFETFSQEDTAAANKYGSSGLGMAISKNIVDMMNGKIEVSSKKGEGTTFKVTVTLIDSDKKESDESMDDLTQSSGNSLEKLSGRRILLAEDVDINAEIMIEVLKLVDIQADHALNGEIAVEKFASQPEHYYDAILMDMRMPKMDGLEATKTIRNMDRADAADIPIIALTANAFEEDVQRSIQAGLNAHLSKPVDTDTLYSTLEEVIVGK